MNQIKKINSLIGIFSYYSFKENNLIKIKPKPGSLVFFISGFNFISINGRVISPEDSFISFLKKPKNHI